MIREEEREQASELAYPYSNGVLTNGMRECFIKGAEWADQHPRKGLWDTEKVCNILRNKMDSNWFYEKIGRADYDSIIEDLRKAMED